MSTNRLISAFPHGGSAWLILMTLAALVVPVTLTMYAWRITSNNVVAHNQGAFEALALESETALRHRLDSYENALAGANAYFLGSDFVSRKEWQRYVHTLDIDKNFPGIDALGYIELVRDDGLDEYTQRVRKDVPDFNIHASTKATSATGGPPYYIVTYFEPVGVNKAAPGFNIASEPDRRAAAELARDSGEPTITRKVTLTRGGQRIAGFWLLHPMYWPALSVGTVQERREALRGWIFAPFVARNFLHALTNDQGALLNLEVYDGTESAPDKLIYGDGMAASGVSKYVVTRQLNFMHRQWLVVWRSTPDFEASHHNAEPILVLTGGLLFTVLLSLVLLLLALRRQKTMEWMANDKGYVVPLAVFMVMAAGVFLLYRQLTVAENRFVASIVVERAVNIRQLIETATQNKLKALQRLAQRWDVANGTPEGQWREDAANYVTQLGGLQALTWVDFSCQPRWSEPNSSADTDFFDADCVDLIKNQSMLASVYVIDPPAQPQRHTVLKAYAIVQRNGQPDGFMRATFNPGELFDESITTQVAHNFEVSIRSGGRILFQSLPSSDSVERELTQVGTIKAYEQEWQLTVAPSTEFVLRQHSWLPTGVLAAGLLLSLLLALNVRAVLVAKLRSAWLADSNRLNNAILSSAASLVVATDRDGTVMLFNKAAEKALGYSAGEVIGKRTPALWHDRKEMEERARELSEELGTPVQPRLDVFFTRGRDQDAESNECTFIRKDGSRFDVSLTITSLRGPEGEVVGYLGLSEDITARKQAERQRDAAIDGLADSVRELRKSEETFRAAMEAASIGMALVKPDGRFMKVNDALCTLLGYQESELLANDFQSITHEEDLERDVGLLRRALAGQLTSYRTEKRYYHQSGRVIWALLSVSVVRDVNGNPDYFVSQIQDITEQREAERIKSEFISVVSHELRTPLTSIRGSLGLILGAFSVSLPEKVARLVNIAHQNCERLIPLINDILDIDKIASGKMRFDMQEISLAQVMKRAVEATEPFAQRYEAQLELQPVAAGIRITVDEDRFVQAVCNLISNACKFSPQRGKVVIAASVAAGQVHLSVSDNGPGIPEEFRGRIFERFSQADSSAVRRAGGTGLGLHITRQIVERMNGRIGFETELGKGTTFWMEFPAVVNAVAVAAPASEIPQQANLPRILHVEDDVDLGRVLAVSLQGRAAVELATSLSHAEQLLRQRRFDMILLDIALPDGSGLDLLDRLESLTGSAMPVVILCAESPPAEVHSRVATVMVKTRLSEAKVVETIVDLLERGQETVDV